MFRHRISSPITEEPNSSFQSGKASIIGMRKSDSMDASTHQQQDPTSYPDYEQQQQEQDYQYQYQYQYGEHLHRPVSPSASSANTAALPSTTTNQDEPLTIESMSAVIAAAVQMSGTTGAKSSLSMGHASIKQTEKKKQQEDKVKRRFSIFTWKKQQQQQQQQQQQRQQEDDTMDPRTDSTLSLSSSASSTTSSPRSSSSATAGTSSVVTTPVDDGLDELAYRGIQIKEIKTTLKPMVIPSNVTNPMPTVKLERPGFARINY
ncbi:hypothetical protein BCR42DRAFT_419235 [Absidia repens]|uniref:Uncharacterized protein n=1 Tax=Absidia repens TaxID=90262 RepID=A0A1X2IB16_9FUNG|nr:hypothetical protein BCR42DRAFT_419235 [Absidia repens]